jgi:hypothetical protein
VGRIGSTLEISSLKVLAELAGFGVFGAGGLA